MCAALTTAAVINHGPYPPDDYIPWTEFAPSHNKFNAQPPKPKLSPEIEEKLNQFNLAVLNTSIEYKKLSNA